MPKCVELRGARKAGADAPGATKSAFTWIEAG
jgi:hypothetical protein